MIQKKEDEKPKQKLLSASYINTTTILLTFDTTLDESVSLPDIEVSNDKSNWKYYKLLPGGLVFVKNNVKYLKVENTDDIVDIQHRELGPKLPEELKDDCQYKGKIFKLGEEYNDDCESLCVCQEIGMKCLKIQCPTYFGVDVLDPNCVEWETVPPEFKASPPNCCPDKVRCKNNGSCYYEGRTYKNWDLLPSNVTGCERKCYCEMGKVECQNTCPPVTAVPPPYLPCPPNLTMISHIPDDDCCKYWVCNSENDASGKIIHKEKRICRVSSYPM
ncbi:hypothetical protein NQ314_007419 [Rhamnusium bicolor]|uniref:VWFC domain-containing protein n=1 Tax=Rhamnusium bicolor TaxID=1586634 RepID=A0AAV8YMD5_9CUCU|nr:hypothetical protein NQ314_007419 [Rhamnusium bicolor]